MTWESMIGVGVGALLGVAAVLMIARWRRHRAQQPLPRGRAARRALRDLPQPTGRTLTGVVDEIVDGQAVVTVTGGAVLVMPDRRRWVGEHITVYEYTDETWHAGPHPSWPTEEDDT